MAPGSPHSLTQLRLEWLSVPGTQIPVSPVHAPVAVHAPHVHDASQLRVVGCVPHIPHAWVPVSTLSGVQPVTPVQAPESTHPRHSQLAQVRTRA